MTLFRPHRGSLAVAMAEVREIDSLAELIAFAEAELGHYSVDVSGLKVEPYCYDTRIDWDTYIVSIPKYGVIGFTNGPLS